MEKFSNNERESGKKFADQEIIKTTSKVLKQLLLWGFIAFNPLSTLDAKAQDTSIQNSTTSERVLSFENRFGNDGLLALRQERQDKPVVVVTTINNIEANYSEQGGFIRTDRSLTSERLMVFFVNNANITVVERGSDFLQAIIEEAKLSDEGLVGQGEEVKLGHWIPADYYVVSSTEKIGDHYIIKNEIIDMVDGSSIFVTVESSNENSESVFSELAQKTEKAIEEHESNKQHGQEQ